MKTLLLLRHAKSSWDDEGLSDHERPLNRRGRRDAPRMGRALAAASLVPELIVTSSAVRALETARAVAEAVGYKNELVVDGRLYHAEPEIILAIARTQEDALERIMLVGHNPGMAELVSRLVGKYEEMPTGAVACFRFPVDRWQELGADKPAELVGVWRPRQLPD